MPTEPTSTPTTNPVAAAAPTPIIATPEPTPAAEASTAPATAPATNTANTPVATDLGTVESDNATAAATMQEVIDKINDSHNILVAISNDPTVDELSAAIGLSLYLDRTGKRATAIYSGHTPNALEFLNPEENLESTTDSLQDFVIALNKDKADHLRYKLDGDYVKIFITPYRTRIAEEDLDFSYGDFNIDLVLSLNISEGAELDSALREYGRIMHDATIINISTKNPGKFGEIEWHNNSASSVSEMAATLIFAIATDEQPIDGDEATAFLTGIIAATDRFSASTTTPTTMQLASRLMTAGADQRLINQNVANIGNLALSDIEPPVKSQKTDPTSLRISHDEAESEEAEEPGESSEEGTDEESSTDASEPTVAPADLSAALAAASENPAPAPTSAPLEPSATDAPLMPSTASAPLEPAPSAQNNFTDTSFATNGAKSATLSGVESAPVWSDNDFIAKPEKTITPSAEFENEVASGGHSDSLEAALAEISADTGIPSTPVAPTAESTPTPILEPTPASTLEPAPAAPSAAPTFAITNLESTSVASAAPTPAPTVMNPAANLAPSVSDKPEINGVPEINYTLPADAEVLPPPPTPPINPDAPLPDLGATEPASATTPATPAATPTTPTNPTPATSNTFQLPNVS